MRLSRVVLLRKPALQPAYSLAEYLRTGTAPPTTDAAVEQAALLAQLRLDPGAYRANVEDMRAVASLLRAVDTRDVLPLEAMVDEYAAQLDAALPEAPEPPPSPARYIELPPVLERD